jgi:hypothetical protein
MNLLVFEALTAIAGIHFLLGKYHETTLLMIMWPPIGADLAVVTLQDIAAGLDTAGISTPRGQGKWTPTQVARTLAVLSETEE